GSGGRARGSCGGAAPPTPPARASAAARCGRGSGSAAGARGWPSGGRGSSPPARACARRRGDRAPPPPRCAGERPPPPPPHPHTPPRAARPALPPRDGPAPPRVPTRPPSSAIQTLRHAVRTIGRGRRECSTKTCPRRTAGDTRLMEVTCCVCGKAFRPSFVYQVAVDRGQRRYYCTLDCRKRGLGDEAFRARRARRIAVLNQKGGTGKTTTAINVAAGLSERGHEVLLLDTDAQGNVGASLGVRGAHTLYHIICEGADPIDASIPVRKHLDVITSDATLAAAEIWLAHQAPDARARVLNQRLNLTKVTRQYAYVILDCGPSLSLLNQN